MEPAAANLPPPVLMRDQIHRQLYEPDVGYFSKHRGLVIAPPPIEFTELANENSWRETVAAQYAEHDVVRV